MTLIYCNPNCNLIIFLEHFLNYLASFFQIIQLISFFRAALDIALEHLNGTEQRFKNGIEQMALKAIASTANEEKNESKREEDQYQPPLGLLDFIPLAELCNSILSR